MKFLNSLLLVFWAFSLTGCFLFGGDDDDAPSAIARGSLNGTVLDDQAQTYGEVNVTLKQNGVVVQTRSSDENGKFEMPSLEVGSYELDLTPPLGSLADPAKSVSITENFTIDQDITFTPQPVPASLVLGATDPLDEVANAQGEVPSDPSDLIYAPLVFEEPLGELHPIIAPDGHHLTLEEWQTATGSATVACEGGETVYHLEFTGLIPNGVYTIWNFVLTRQLSATSSINMATDVAASGALGDGESNTLVASENGAAELEVRAQPGPLTMFGDLSPCAITTTPGFVLIINYHIDGQTHGGVPGPDKDDVAHLLIYF